MSIFEGIKNLYESGKNKLVEKTYINNQISEEVNEKGFSVYNYIDEKELLLTVKKDYLSILSMINLPFLIGFVILFAISYSAANPLPIIGFMFFSYVIIFLILFLKLFARSYYFYLVSNVIYTNKGILLGNEIFLYEKNYKELEKSLGKYENIFSEYLSMPSNLEELVNKKRKEFSSSTGRTLNKFAELVDNIDDRASIILFIGAGIYVISIHIFYYIGYFLGFGFFYSYFFFLKTFLKFFPNLPLQTKLSIEKLNYSISAMNKNLDLIEKKISEFEGGEISNLENFIEKHFGNFYAFMQTSLSEKKYLEKILFGTEFVGFVDEKIVRSYLGERFNLPILKMISLLENYKKINENGILELEKTTSEINVYTGNLETKKEILQRNINIISNNLETLKKSLI